MHIILSRTDNIGDVILTLPMAALLKQQWPASKITLLGKSYTESIANCCPSIDTFLNWDEIKRSPKNQLPKADVIIHVFPNKKIAKLAKASKIKQRIGTSRRWYHWLYCTDNVSFSRAQSDLHEAQLNIKLLKPLKINLQPSLNELAQLTTLQNTSTPNDKIQSFLSRDKFNLLIHPLSNKSAREWPMQHFIDLCNTLPTEQFNIIVTGSKDEFKLLKNTLFPFCKNIRDTSGKLTLAELIALIQSADGIVVGSTGPLHIAASSGIKTLGLFPPKKNINPKRWGPIGKQATYIIDKDNCDVACNHSYCPCMQNITVSKVHTIITGWLKDD